MSAADSAQRWICSIDRANFERAVRVDFWAGWCAPCLLPVALAVLLLVPVVATSGTAASRPLTRLAYVLKDSPLPMRSDFTWLALDQMAAFYHEEAARARTELRHSAKAGSAASWAASVDDYARKVTVVADSISTESSISIAIGINNEVNVYVDGRPMILTAAVSSQQAAYEQRVLERFCTLYLCADLLGDIDYGEPGQDAGISGTQGSNAYWSFSQHAGPVCMTDDGLEFQFLQLSELAEMRVLCSQVVNELSELAVMIAREQQQGMHIDWDRLAVLPATADADNRVILAGQLEIDLALPVLAERAELLRRVRPWLEARVRGESYQLTVLNAERMLDPATIRADAPAGLRYPALEHSDRVNKQR